MIDCDRISDTTAEYLGVMNISPATHEGVTFKDDEIFDYTHDIGVPISNCCSGLLPLMCGGLHGESRSSSRQLATRRGLISYGYWEDRSAKSFPADEGSGPVCSGVLVFRS